MTNTTQMIEWLDEEIENRKPCPVSTTLGANEAYHRLRCIRSFIKDKTTPNPTIHIIPDMTKEVEDLIFDIFELVNGEDHKQYLKDKERIASKILATLQGIYAAGVDSHD